MRKLMLLVAAGSLWLFLAAIPVFADGGPHSVAVNSGVSTLTTDSCAGCHRAHTASAPMLLAQDEEQLCLSCHGAAGTGATTDVATGVQYRVLGSSGPAWTTGTKALGALARPTTANGHYYKVTTPGDSGATEPTWVTNGGTVTDGTAVWTDQGTPAGRSSTELGALRGGGFEEARIGDPYRWIVAVDSFNSKVRAKVGTGGNTASATVTSAHMPGLAKLTQPGTAWGQGANGSGVGSPVAGGLSCGSCHNPHGNNKYRILKPVPVSATFNASVAKIFSYTGTTKVYKTVASHGFLVGDTVVVAGVTGATGANTAAAGAVVATVPNDTSFTLTGITEAANGDSNSGTASLSGGVTVTDGPAVPAGDARNYTVIQTSQAAGYTLLASQAANFSATQGDYFHYRVPWDGSGPVTTTSPGYNYDAPNGQPGTLALSNGRWSQPVGQRSFGQEITAWCSSCHTRYFAYSEPTDAVGGTGAAYNTARPGSTGFGSKDADYTYQHRTRGSSARGCLTCHVSHGSNAVMSGLESKSFTYPGATGVASNSSRLLKVDNRGTCNLCHDPTLSAVPADNPPLNTVPSVP